MQLVAALEGPVLLYPQSAETAPGSVLDDLGTGWQVLVERLCG
ncbi:hypothetical protein [Nocardia sp. NRRL S-836]|nr:hypothetical protein [Nocardia sp. NRRL S-836]